MSNNFRYQQLVAVFGKLGGRVRVVDDAFLSHEQKLCPTTSFDENCILFPFETDRSHYVIWDSLTWLWNWNLWRFVVTKVTIPNKFKKEHNEVSKADEEQTAEEEEEAPVPLVNHVDSILHSIFLVCRSTISSFKSQMDSIRTNPIFPTTLRELSVNTKGFCTARVTTMRIFPMRFWKHFCLNPFFTRRMKLLSLPDGFILYGKLGIDFIFNSELLHSNENVRLHLFRARPNFYMISDNPNVSLGSVDCSLFTRGIALNDDYPEKGMNMLAYTPMEYNYLEILAKTFISPGRHNQFFEHGIFYKASVRRIAIAMNSNSAFEGSYTENPIRHQQFDLRQNRILIGGQPIVHSDAANNCRFYVLAMKAINSKNDMPSIPNDNFKDHHVLLFDLTSMQDAPENCPYQELVGEPLRLELNLTFPPEQVTELIVLGEWMSLAAVDKFGVVGKNI